MRIMANVAIIGKYKVKVINSLVHGGPYAAIHIEARRVAWFSFKEETINFYSTTTKNDKDEINLVDAWFKVKENYNLAARLWNDFKNGVPVTLKGE